MVSLFISVYQEWDIKIMLSCIIEDFSTNFHTQLIRYKEFAIKGYMSEYYTCKLDSIQKLIDKSFIEAIMSKE